MKSFFPVLLAILVSVLGIETAAQFTWVNPLPQGNSLRAVDFVSPTVGFAAGEAGTLLKTTDGGTHWEILPPGVFYNLYDIAATDTLHAVAAGDSGNVLITSDGGGNWAETNLGVDQQVTKVSMLSPSLMFAATAGQQVFRTTDGGVTWQTSLTTAPGVIRGICFPMADTGYIVGGWGAYNDSAGYLMRTVNSGLDWEVLCDTFPRSLMCVDFTSANSGHAGTRDGYYIRISNSGTAYETFSTPLALYGSSINVIRFYNEQTGFAVNYGGYFIRTTNGGQTWDGFPAPVNEGFNGLDVIDGMKVCAVGNIGNILVSDNGFETSTNIRNGIKADLKVIHNSGDAIRVFGEGTVVTSADGGNTWTTESVSELDYLVDVAFYSSTHGLALTYTGLYRTEDSGSHWLFLSGVEPFPSDDGRAFFFQDLELAGADQVFYCGGGYSPGGLTWTYIKKSSDGGLHWTTVSQPAEFPADMAFPSATKGFAVCNNGVLLTSEDAGDTWNTRSILPGYHLTNICFVSPDTGYLIGYGGSGPVYVKLLATVDGGNKWNERSSIELRPGQDPLELKFESALIGYLLGYNGFNYHTTDGGYNWSKVALPTGNGIEDMLRLNDDAAIYVGRAGTMIRFGESTGGCFHEFDPQTLTCYPNPFDQSVSVMLPVGSGTDLTVDWERIDGKLMARTTQTISKGCESVNLDIPAGITSGFYILRIRDENRVYSAKVIRR